MLMLARVSAEEFLEKMQDCDNHATGRMWGGAGQTEGARGLFMFFFFFSLSE